MCNRAAEKTKAAPESELPKAKAECNLSLLPVLIGSFSLIEEAFFPALISNRNP
jgi:hypothetical protein